MKEKDIKQLLTDLYKEARTQKYSRARIKEAFKKFVSEIDEIDRGILNKLCGLSSTNTDLDKLALELVILYDRQYEQDKDNLVNALQKDIENKREEENDSAWGFIGIFLPFIIGGAIGLFIGKDIGSFIGFGMVLYVPIVAFMIAHIFGAIIAIIIEMVLYEIMPNDILKLAVLIVPSVGAFIYQIVDYIKKKSIREKAEKENAENIDYVKNDYNENNTQNKISGSEQLRLESKEVSKKNNSVIIGTIIAIVLIFGGAYTYSYFHTLSNNWQWQDGGRCYIDKNGNKLINTMINERLKTYYVDANGKMVEKTWVEYEGNLYYFNDDGVMVKDDFVYYNKDTFLVDKEGKLMRNTYNTDKKGQTRYFGQDGKMVKDAITPDGRKANKYGTIN